MPVALFMFLTFVITGSLKAETLSQPNRIEITQDIEIKSEINHQLTHVGILKKGSFVEIKGGNTAGYQFSFGNGTATVDSRSAQLKTESTKKQGEKSEGEIELTGDYNTLINNNIITSGQVTIYRNPDEDSQPIAVLAENLRYPVEAKVSNLITPSWYEVKIGGQHGFIRQDHVELDEGIPVLTYHHILKNDENRAFKGLTTTTSFEAFSRQMEEMKELGYQTISVGDLERYINNRINLSGKVVVLTFDDGLKSVYRYAYPVLKKLNFSATAFIITSRIKRYPQIWNPDFLQSMSISELQEIHTVFDFQTHTHFQHRYAGKHRPVLLTRTYHNILRDFERSRRALQPFNSDVQYLAYPFGGYNQTAIEAAKNSGLRLAFTTELGKVKPGDAPYTLKRLYLQDSDTSQDIAARLGNTQNRAVITALAQITYLR